MRFPSIKVLASHLVSVNRSLEFYGEEGIDTRLQVLEDGTWEIHTGDSQYDQDHRGYWGSNSLPGDGHRFNSREVAKDLIDQVKEVYYTSQTDK